MLNLFSSLLSLKAGGRNSCASLFSKSGVHSSGGEGDCCGYVKLQSLRYCAVVLPLGFACSHKCGTGPILRPWIWALRTCLTFFSLRFPLIHMFSLTLTPTALIGRMPGCTEPWWVASIDLTEPRYYWQTEDSQELLSPLALKPFLPRQKSDIFCQDSTVQRRLNAWRFDKKCIWGEEWCKTFHVCVQPLESLNFFFELRKAETAGETHQVSGAVAAAQKRGDRKSGHCSALAVAPDEKGT